MSPIKAGSARTAAKSRFMPSSFFLILMVRAGLGAVKRTALELYVKL
jgi:hypothetical protein